MCCSHCVEIASTLKAKVTLSHGEDREFIDGFCQFHWIDSERYVNLSFTHKSVD